MIFQQLLDTEYFIYLEETENGLVCQKADTPENILKEFEEINAEYRKIFEKDFITIKGGKE